jgi:acyl dehydratase
MSKPVRLPDYLHAEVERLAKEERRSLANMVAVLLEQALRMDDHPITKTENRRGVQAQTVTSPRVERMADDHFKPDFKK